MQLRASLASLHGRFRRRAEPTLGRRKLRRPANNRAAAADGSRTAVARLRGDRRRHAFGDLADHRVSKHNAERPDDKIDVGRADDNRFSPVAAPLWAPAFNILAVAAVCTDSVISTSGKLLSDFRLSGIRCVPPCQSITNTFIRFTSKKS